MPQLLFELVWRLTVTTLILALICGAVVLLAIALRRAARYVAAAVDTWWWHHKALRVARDPLEDVDLSDLDGELRALLEQEAGQ